MMEMAFNQFGQDKDFGKYSNVKLLTISVVHCAKVAQLSVVDKSYSD